MPENIAVLGAGSWGIASANLLSGNGHNIRLWEFNPAEYESLARTRMLPRKLPGIKIEDRILITNHLEEAVRGAGFVVMVVPSQKVRQVCRAISPFIKSGVRVVNLSKGIEMVTLARMSEVIIENVSMVEGEYVATLSGPCHAEEVARRMPTSVVAASSGAGLAEEVQQIFSGQFFRVYRSTDIIGVELGGALKNIIAIAAGIIAGLGMGDNTLGALMTRGQAEITRMGVHLGADPATFAGLSGIGDLITTCISRHSRNRLVGERIGRGEKLPAILESMTMVAEGVDTCRSGLAMAQKYGMEMPITVEVHKVLFEDKNPSEAVADLMRRTLKEEIWSRPGQKGN